MATTTVAKRRKLQLLIFSLQNDWVFTKKVLSWQRGNSPVKDLESYLNISRNAIKNTPTMNFSEITKVKLAAYKIKTFPGIPDGRWKNNKQHYAHILPENNKLDNLLKSFSNTLISYLIDKEVQLHTDFNHLNSSQAMCLNFFFPLYHERSLELITDFLGFQDETIDYNSVEFEKKGLEAALGSKKPTSFDFFFKTMSGKKFHFEIKYTEGEFGKDSENDLVKRQKKFDKYYLNAVKAINVSYHNSQNFSENYQILRNLIHIDDNSYVIFIYPQNNHAVSKGAERVTTHFLASDHQKYFFSKTWENLFDYVLASTNSANIKMQLDEFRNKYLM